MSPLKLLLLAGASSIVTAFSTALPNPNTTAVSVGHIPEGESLPVDEGHDDLLGCGFGDCVAAAAVLVSIGQLAWGVASSGAESPELAGKYFGAGPKNWGAVTGWKDTFAGGSVRYNMMQGWSGSRNLLLWKNKFGADLCAIRTNLRREYGGSVNGVGSYLNNVRLELDYIDDIWISAIHANVEYSNPTNVGTSKNPIAKTTMTLKVHCDNGLQDLRSHCEWDIYGHGRVSYRGCRDPTGGRRLDDTFGGGTHTDKFKSSPGSSAS